LQDRLLSCLRDEEVEKRRKKQGNFKTIKLIQGDCDKLPIISELAIIREDYRSGVLWEMETASPGENPTV
jgi:hypothetical protein